MGLERSGLPSKAHLLPYSLEFCGGISNFHISVTDICSKLIKKNKEKQKRIHKKASVFCAQESLGRLVKTAHMTPQSSDSWVRWGPGMWLTHLIIFQMMPRLLVCVPHFGNHCIRDWVMVFRVRDTVITAIWLSKLRKSLGYIIWKVARLLTTKLVRIIC